MRVGSPSASSRIGGRGGGVWVKGVGSVVRMGCVCVGVEIHSLS